MKQQRQLSRRPEVVVATPGRFWEMAGTHAHLSRLETLRHLVVDEADRMLERGHYPELNRLFSMLEKAEGRDVEGGGGGGGGSGRGGRFKKYKLPFDISEGGEWSVPREDKEEGEDEGDTFDDDAAMDESDGDDDNSDGSTAVGGSTTRQPPTTTTTAPATTARDFARQTYVFSATLTLGSSGRQQRKGGASAKSAVAAAAAAAAAKAKGKKVKGRGKAPSGEEDDAVTKIMKRVGVRGDPAVIDMGRRSVGGGGAEAVGGGEEDAGPVAVAGGGEAASGLPALPTTLKLCSIKSLQVR